MSIATTLRRAAKLQEKIEELRGQLARLLDQARSEVIAADADEMPVSPRRPGRPKMFKSNGRRQTPKIGLAISKRVLVTSGSPVAKSPAGRGGKRRKHSPLLGVKRAASPSGPLAPAVVDILQAKRRPMKVSDILIGLNAKGYQFTSSEPRKNLAARIYRLKGVKQVSAGLFAAI